MTLPEYLPRYLSAPVRGPSVILGNSHQEDADKTQKTQTTAKEVVMMTFCISNE